MKFNFIKKQNILAIINYATALSLAFVFLFGVIYKTQPVLAVGVVANANSANSQNTSKTLSATQVIVTPSPVSAQIKVSSTPVVLATSCKVPVSGQNLNLVQDGATVNLNQPADCFSLNFAVTKVSTKNLTVSNLEQTAKVILVNSQSTLQSPYLTTSPLDATTLPVLPIASFAITAELFMVRRKILTKALSLKNQFQENFVFNQMQVLRC